MKTPLIPVFALALLCCVCMSSYSQDVLLLTEDFELGGLSFTLNDVGPGTNTGDNQWIINDQYIGDGTYPNTTTQDNTNGGTIGFAPTSNYLHIHDLPSGVLNANYDPTAASDRFAYTTFGVCTYGMVDVHFSFFYLCEGSASAFGSVYYSIDGGAWTQFGANQYSNTTIWQYTDLSDPAFSNVGDLRFGFRWQNDSGAPPYAQSFGVDDITIVGTYSEVDPVTITITDIFPGEVCQGAYVTISYELSDTLCDGTYLINLSNAFGNFTGQFGSWVFPINYPQTTGSVTIQIPTTAPVGDCYRIRIDKVSPPPEITGIPSDCFSVIECPNIITTLQPVVTMDTNAVCVGSVIDVPFTSTGVYAANNDYVAQLSDPDGTFPGDPLEVGSSDDNNTYDPNLGGMPGSVSGLIPPTEPGCNYYIRVISTNPDAIGSVWGPFCIQECDITTNEMQDLSFCVNECDVDPDGENTVIDVDVNTYDNSATYLPGNLFTTQLLSSQNFGQIGSNGILGEVAATGDTELNIHVPCKDSLALYGIPLGMNYMRVVATNSTAPDNTLGSLIHVTIGAYTNEPQVITSYQYPEWIPKDVFCVGEIAILSFQPYNYFDNSTYMWTCNGINGGAPFESPSGPNSNTLYVNLGGAGTLTFSVQETNYGCVSPWTPITEITVLGNPNANIQGPSTVCQGELVQFDVNFYPNTYYTWSTSADISEIAYQDTSNNELNIAFSEVGTYTLNVDVLNLCGSDSDDDTVEVIASPTSEAAPDTTVCVNDPVDLSITTQAGYSYSWSDDGGVIGSTPDITVNPDETTYYYATVTSGECSNTDTVEVLVEYPDPATLYFDSICPGGLNQILLIANGAGEYLWSTGSTDEFINVNDTGMYSVEIDVAGLICPDIEEFEVLPMTPDPPVMLVDSICPGGFNDVVLTSAFVGNYLWSTGETTQSITVHDTGDFSVDVYDDGAPCPQSAIWEILPLEPDSAILLTDSVCPGGFFPITLQADQPGQYFWSTGQTAGLIHVNDTGLYVVTIHSPNERCERTLQWTIIPDTCYALPELIVHVPNAFTPNGDFINDVFGPVFSEPELLTEYNMSIFDRWGVKIFETTDVTKYWMGNAEGGEYFVPDGVYVWRIVYKGVGIVDELQAMGHVVVTR